MINNRNCYSNCKYHNNCIKPCRKVNGNKLGSALVRSQEAREKQNLNKSIVNLEKDITILELKYETNTNSILEPILVGKCLSLRSSKVLPKSQEAIQYMNWSKRIKVVSQKLNRLIDLTDSEDIINNQFINPTSLLNICKCISILNQRLKIMDVILDEKYEQ